MNYFLKLADKLLLRKLKLLKAILKLNNKFLRISGSMSVYLWSAVIGAIAGVGAILFSYALSYVEKFTYDSNMGIARAHPLGDIHIEAAGVVAYNPWMVFFFPILGGLLVGLIVHYFCPEAEGTGTESMIKAFHLNEGRIPLKVSFFKAIATIVTLSTGGSAGKEGPTSQIGAGIGSSVASFLKAGARARRTLMLAGTAGGLGAIFQAPLGGAIVAVEVMYKEDIESDALIPCIISSVTAYLVFSGYTGSSSVFYLERVSFNADLSLYLYLCLGILSFSAGHLFLGMFNYLRDAFEKLPVKRYFRPALGGVVVGLVGLFFPQVIGTGLGYVQEILLNPRHEVQDISLFAAAGMFLLFAILKMITTSFTIGSGGSGGVMGPSLFIGAMLGASVATLSQQLFPLWDISVTSFMLVGMGAFFAGVCSAPISGVIMVSDMAGSYELLLPLMIVAIVTLMGSKKKSIYRGQFETRFDSPAHHWDMNWDILDSIKIKDHFTEFLTKAIVPKTMLLSELESNRVDLQANHFVVTNEDGSYFGIIGLSRIQLTKEQLANRSTIRLSEVTNSKVPVVNPNQSVSEALRILSVNDIGKIAVVAEENPDQLLGYLRSGDVMRFYQQKIQSYDNGGKSSKT